MRLSHKAGASAEDAACTFLQNNGYTVLARNWHCPFGEIDIVAEDAGVLVFVEVRFRKNSTFGGAAASITPTKLEKIRRSALHYLQKHTGGNCHCRIDALLFEGTGTPVHLRDIG